MRNDLRAPSRHFEHLIRLDAVCADLHAPGASVDFGADHLKIREPSPARKIMGVADIVAAHRRFAADLTHFRHGTTFQV